jgi:predicted nucleic acid-binding protein
MFEDVPRRHTAQDPDDAYLLDLAELAGADYLITGDKRSGLLKRKKIAGTSIMAAMTFCERILQ